MAVLGRRHLDSGSERTGAFPGLTLQPSARVLATLRRTGPPEPAAVHGPLTP